ncbi:MAG: hypothetical protein M1833_002277 [Piccolia ochrophora]|nr:MAG: hypothetical protein M1833_002277 [Piccolia ochrophora]
MSYTFQVPKDYGYVVLITAFSMVLAVWHALQIGQFRKRAKVPFPHHYAPQRAYDKDARAANAFDCAQRAHGNYLENHPTVMMSMLVAGLEYPRSTAVLGGLWCVARIMYLVGYVTSGPGENGKRRRLGTWFFIPQVGLMGLLAFVGWGLLVS